MTKCNGAKFLPHNSISLSFWTIFFTENIGYPFNIFPVIGTWGTKYLKAMFTPWYFAWSTTSRMCPCSEYLYEIGCLALLTWMTWHLLGLNSMSQSASLICKCSKSFWMVLLWLMSLHRDRKYIFRLTIGSNTHVTIINLTHVVT